MRYGEVLLRGRWAKDEGAFYSGNVPWPVMVVTPPDGPADSGAGMLLDGPDRGRMTVLAVYDHITMWDCPDGLVAWFDRRDRR